MDLLPKIFLEDISKIIFHRNVPPETQYLTFIHRFHCDNYSFRHTDIGEFLSETVAGDYKAGINQFIKEVIKKIEIAFRDELLQYGITKEKLGLSNTKGKNGRKKSGVASPWEVVYKWLWKVKYPLWQQDYIWDSWKQIAITDFEWIQFQNKQQYSSRAIKPKWKKFDIKSNLPINIPLNWSIQINRPSSYLILFNRGLDLQGQISQYLVAPSQAFAPKYQLSKHGTLVPQQDAMCEDIEFDAVGREEYLGILIDEALDLPWLTPDPENPCLKWQGTHLGELWEKLHDKDNWLVLYRDFEVVAKNV